MRLKEVIKDMYLEHQETMRVISKQIYQMGIALLICFALLNIAILMPRKNPQLQELTKRVAALENILYPVKNTGDTDMSLKIMDTSYNTDGGSNADTTVE